MDHFCHGAFSGPVCNQRDAENSLTCFGNCSGNSPCYFLSPLLQLLVFKMWDCVFSKTPEPIWKYLVMLQTFCEPDLWDPGCTGYLASEKHCSALPRKEKVCPSILMIHCTSGLWSGCVCALEVRTWLRWTVLYALELFLKNIQWFFLISSKELQHFNMIFRLVQVTLPPCVAEIRCR